MSVGDTNPYQQAAKQYEVMGSSEADSEYPLDSKKIFVLGFSIEKENRTKKTSSVFVVS